MSSCPARAPTSASRATRPRIRPIDASLARDGRGLPGVEAAAGGIVNETDTKIIDKDGKAINTQGAPSFGFGIDSSPDVERFNPLNLVEGRYATASDEVVIDAGTADREGFAVGDRVEISTLRPKREFEIVGIAKYGDVDSLGTATFAVFDIPTAQSAARPRGPARLHLRRRQSRARRPKS